jgi:hypothetical protein
VVRKNLAWPRRIGAWVRANPFVFGLPGRRYTESMALDLVANDSIYDAITLVPTAERVLDRRLAEPDYGVGGLWVIAPRRIVAKPDPNSGFRVAGGLVPDELLKQSMRSSRKSSRNDEESAVEVMTLSSDTELVAPLDKKERDEGTAAGWVLT